MGANRYSRRVDLADVNNAHSLAVHLVPPGSLVLDVGAADGSVAGVLRDQRGCRVWAVEKEPESAEAARRWCERVLRADVETLDLDAAFPGERFDVVLLLDVLEHLVDPGEMLRRAGGLLASGGRIVASIPNVAHAAVRVQLLAGRFTRTATGLLDRTHLHFFDRSSMTALFLDAGLEIMDDLQVTRRVDETEIPVTLEAIPKEVLGGFASDDDSETYQFVVTARAARRAGVTAAPASLAEALQKRARRLEISYRELEGGYRNVEGELLSCRAELARMGTMEAASQTELARMATLEAASRAELARMTTVEASCRVLESRTHDLAAQLAEGAMRRAELERDNGDLQEQLAAARQEGLSRDDRLRAAEQSQACLAQAHQDLGRQLEAALASRDALLDQVRQLELAVQQAREGREQLVLERRHQALDAEVKDAYVMEMRLALDESEAGLATAQAARARDRHALESLEADLSDARRQVALQSLAMEAHRLEVLGYQQTLALPRYALADRLNRMLRVFGPLHGALKRMVLPGRRRSA